MCALWSQEVAQVDESRSKTAHENEHDYVSAQQIRTNTKQIRLEPYFAAVGTHISMITRKTRTASDNALKFVDYSCTTLTRIVDAA